MVQDVTGSHTKGALDGLFKDVYGDKLDSLIPDFSLLMKKIPFSEAKKTGRDYVKSIKLTNEQGFTYGSGLAPLADIISSDVDDAKVRGNSLTLRTGFSYDAASNMASSKGAFIDATKFKFMSMMEASSHRIEQQMLYGGSGLGVIASISGAGPAFDLVIDDASWSAGTWVGQEGASIDVHVANTSAKRNASNDCLITAIDPDNKTISVSCADALAASVVAGDVIYFDNAYDNEMVGLRNIVANSGTLYGVSGASYSLWKGNSLALPASTNLTLKKIYEGLSKPVGKGLMEDVSVLVSPATYATIANDEASLRRYNVARGQAENGFETVKFYGQNGMIEIVPHALMREQEAMAFPMKRAERIGATDITFKTPGKGDEMFQQLSDYTGYECRLYSEQAIFLPCPAKCVLFTNISNS